MTPTIFAAVVVLAGLLARGGAALTVQLVLCLFGAAAAISLPALGGATVTPAVLFLPFLSLRALGDRAELLSFRRVSRATFWLGLLALWGVLSALLFPRLFAGDMQILTVDRNGANLGATLLPLGPVSGNITQSGYALGGALAFFAVRRLLKAKGRLQQFRDAALLLGALNVLAALLNLAEFHLGLPGILAYVRTGNYAIFDAYEEAGLMRVQGTFSETSAFSAFTLPLFAFALSLWLQRVRSVYSGSIALASLSLLLISTSTTAYAALAVYSCAFAVVLGTRAYLHGQVPRVGALLGWAVAICLGTLVIGLVRPEILARVSEFAKLTVLSKLDTSSGFERSSWNRQAWANFRDTFGLGVGLGSARASGFALVLLSNVGVVGTLLFAAFLWATCRGLPGEFTEESAVPRASRHAVLAALAAAFVSGAVFDLGVAFYAFAAAASMRRGQVPRRAQAASSSSASRWQRAAASQLY
jgi:hypothetical protein